jgi:hypothetical protein
MPTIVSAEDRGASEDRSAPEDRGQSDAHALGAGVVTPPGDGRWVTGHGDAEATRAWLPRAPQHRGRIVATVVAGVLATSLAACGGSSGSGSAAARTHQTTGTSRSAGAAPAGNQQASTQASLTAARLGGLTNYSFEVSFPSDHTTATGKVHSRTDWELTTQVNGLTSHTYDVDGQATTVADVGGLTGEEPRTFHSPEGVDTLQGEEYFATAFLADLRDPAFRVRASGTCTVAGVSGTHYVIDSFATASSTLEEQGDACVAGSTGALLSYSLGITGGSAAAAAGVTGFAGSFEVTSIGGVSPITAPAASAASGPTP